MEKFWKFFIAKQQFSYLLVITAVIFGVFAIITIPKESAPEIRVPVGIITIIFPGASAVDVERLITNPVEDRLRGSLKELKKITSTSRESVASIVAEFNADADLDKSIQNLRDEIDKIKPDLPENAEDPVVTEVNFSDQPILTIAIGGDIPESELQRIAKTLKDEIVAVRGVSRVSVGGERDEEVRVIARRDALETFGITLQEISLAIKNSNTALPAGSIEIEGIEYTVQFEGSITDPETVRNIAIGNRAGTPIYVGDVADVIVGFEKRSTLSRVSIEGRPSRKALSFDIFKQSGGNVAVITENVRERVDELSEVGELLDGLEVLTVFDSGEFLKKDLVNLTRTGLQTILLVTLILFISIGWREALLAGIAIPFSFLIAFIALESSGNTINFISLFSLILVIGILVDSAIVMIEGIHTNMRKQMDKREAAEKAIKEFHWPITAGTMTTIAVFAPLFLISGITGEFISTIPFTIIFVLLASLLVALGIVPLFASRFLRRRMMSRLEEQQEIYTEKIRAWYRNKLTSVLGNRRRENRFFALIIGALVLALSLPVMGLVQTEFFPQEDTNFIFIELEQRQGTVIEKTDLEIRKVEEILYSNPAISSFVTTVGQSSPFLGNGASSGSKFANIFINLYEDREESSTEVVTKLREDLSKIRTSKIRVSEPNSGPPAGAPIVVKLQGGNSLASLDVAAGQIENIISDIPGTANVRTNIRDNGIEFVLTLDHAKAASLGISPIEVASTLRTAIRGTKATSIKKKGADIDIIVVSNLNLAYDDPHETNRVTVEALKQIRIRTPHGSVLLGSIISDKVEQSRSSITHEDGERTANVSSDLTEDGNTAVITRAIEKKLKEIELPEGVRASIGGENEDAQQAFKDMFGALVLGIILMLAVLVLQFNSYRHALIVLSILPFSLIGIFVGLLLTHNTLSFTSMMGFIALMGIVVNNSIILIDLINRLRREKPKESIYNIVVEGAVTRLRPILLTTVTTVIGLIPLAFVSALWSPLAISIIFGLSFAVVITLLLVPIIYNRWPGKIK